MTVNEPYAEVMERRFGVARPLDRHELLVPPRPAGRAAAAVPRALGLDPADAGRPLPRRLLAGSRDRAAHRGDAVAAVRHRAGAPRLRRAPGPSCERRASEPALAGRLLVLPAVPPDELLDWVGSADVVAMPIQPSTLNHRLTTPNKLFEAMAAGVPVVASDLPGMAAIVRETGCGVLCDPTSPGGDRGRDPFDPRRAAAGAGRLSGARDRGRPRPRTAGRRQVEILLAEYGRLTGRPW